MKVLGILLSVVLLCAPAVLAQEPQCLINAEVSKMYCHSFEGHGPITSATLVRMCSAETQRPFENLALKALFCDVEMPCLVVYDKAYNEVACELFCFGSEDRPSMVFAHQPFPNKRETLVNEAPGSLAAQREKIKVVGLVPFQGYLPDHRQIFGSWSFTGSVQYGSERFMIDWNGPFTGWWFYENGSPAPAQTLDNGFGGEGICKGSIRIWGDTRFGLATGAILP